MTDLITSRQNQWVQRFRLALDEYDEEIVLEGTKQVADAISLEWKPIAVLLAESAPPVHANAIRVSQELAEWIAGTRTTQGVFALFARPRRSAAEIPRSGPIVALDRIQDPGNVGTIIRLALAFDVAGMVVLPGTASPWSPKALRASTGSPTLRMPMIELSIAGLVELANERNARLLAADTRGSELDPSVVSDQDVIVFGSEGTGLSTGIEEAARLVSIPFSRQVESLNVASAAAIILSNLWSAKRAR